MSSQITELILKIAELCNLNCSYCYLYQHQDKTYRHRPKFMSDEVFGQVLLRAKEYCDSHKFPSIDLVFHGGEPTLIGAERFGRLTRWAKEVLGEQRVHLGIQTNATLMTRRLAEIVKSEGMRVGISLDGPSEVHDAFRVNHAGKGSYQATLRGIRLLQATGVDPGVNCVIDPGVDGLPIYHHFRALGFKRISYLFPDVSHDNKERLYGRYGESPLARYLLPIFDEWLAEDNPEIRVEPFWSLIRRMIGDPRKVKREDFGNPSLSYLVIETDGSIHTVDSLRVCEEGIEDSGLNVMQHSFDDLHRGSPLTYQLVYGIPLSAICCSCPEASICGGGYLPHRYARANGFDNPSVWCQDILILLAHIRSHIFARPA